MLRTYASGYSEEGMAVDGGCSGWRALMGKMFIPTGLHNQCRSDSGNSYKNRKRLRLVTTTPPLCGM